MDDLEAGKLTECCELLNTIANQEDNKKCFDCTDNNSPRYLCSTYLTFVCSCCASIHQELGHKIKVLSVFGFTVNEIYVLKGTGNKVAADKWLARWDPELFNEPDPTSPTYKEDARNYMKAKYIEKKWVKRPPPLPLSERKAAASPVREVDASPRGVPSVDASPRGSNDVSPRGLTDASPRRYSSEFARSTDVSPRGNSVERDEYGAFKQQQHDSEKPPFNPFLRDPYPTTPPVVYSYMPQHMIMPLSFPPGQYGYPQYPVAVDLNQFPAAYYSCPTPFQPPMYPFSAQIAPSVAQDTTSWADTRPRERVMQQSCKELPRFHAEDMPRPVPVLRSASDNSLATTMRQAIEEAAAAHDSNVSTGIATTPATPLCTTPSKTEQHKQKIQGLVSKVAGLLKKSHP